MECWRRVVCAILTILSFSLSTQQPVELGKSTSGNCSLPPNSIKPGLPRQHTGNDRSSFYSWLASVLEASGEASCILKRPLLVAPEQLKAKINNSTFAANSKAVLSLFLSHSCCCGCDLEQWRPPDWVARPPKLAAVKDSTLKAWSLEIHRNWLSLGRQVSLYVRNYPERSSLLHLPHPFILPSPESHEMHYWESYWLVQGLLLSGMEATARMTILNLASLVKEFGFVPSGGRVYLSSRSEPPVLTQMTELYYKHTSDLSLVVDVLPSLLEEYSFWMRERVVDLPEGVLNIYASSSSDLHLKKNSMADAVPSRLSLPDKVADFSESGWPRSSRWFIRANLPQSKSGKILPVDLNALLAQNEISLHRLYSAVGQKEVARHFLSAYQARCRIFDNIFWSAKRKLWLDVDLATRSHREGFYGSSLVPLLWGCEQDPTRHLVVLETIKDLGVLGFPGGIPTSLSLSPRGSEWDFPQATAPLQWFPVLAWHNARHESLRRTARQTAQRWAESLYQAWKKHHILFDKLLSTKVGAPAHNSRTIEVQTGLGWSSGVLLHFFSLYPDLNLTSDHHSQEEHQKRSDLPSKEETTAGRHLQVSRRILTIHSAEEAAATGDNTTTPTGSPHRPSYAWVAAPVVVCVASVVVLVLCLFWCRWLFVAGETRYWRRVQNEHLQAASRGGGGGGGEGDEDTARDQRDSSEETDEHVDNDQRGLFTTFDV